MFNSEAVTVDWSKIEDGTLTNVRSVLRSIHNKYYADDQVLHILQTAVPNWILIPGLVWGFDERSCEELAKLLDHDIYKRYLESL